MRIYKLYVIGVITLLQIPSSKIYASPLQQRHNRLSFILEENLGPHKGNNTLKTILNFVPCAGHFYSGQWRKGVSDLWNTFTIFWFFYEPYCTSNRWQEELDSGKLLPTSREYTILSRNIKLFRELQYGLFTMVMLNYINSVIDCFSSNDDESFFGSYLSLQALHSDTYIAMSNGYKPVEATRFNPHFGLIFGYRNVFEFYAKMFVVHPNDRIRYANMYSDYIVPFKLYENLDFYIGIGFLTGGYFEQKYGTQFGGGGAGLRLGSSYVLANNHYFRISIVPYRFWSEVIFNDQSETDIAHPRSNPRVSSQPFGDNWGFQSVYKYKIVNRLYFETTFDFSKVVEPGGKFIEQDPQDGSEITITCKDRTSYIYRFDLSLNYSF